MVKKKNKVPKSLLPDRVANKAPVIANQERVDSLAPTWAICKFDGTSVRWGMDILKKHFDLIFDKLKSFELMSWHEIKQQTHDNGKSSNHSIETYQLSKEAKNRLSDIKMDDLETIFSIRLSNTFRIIGIKEGRVLQLLWIDPNHEVCPSKKKHT